MPLTVQPDPPRDASPRGPSLIQGIGDAIVYCLAPVRLRRTLLIALVVGIILTLINLGDVILDGRATGVTAVKAGLNFVVPFVVSNLGLLSGRGTADGHGNRG